MTLHEYKNEAHKGEKQESKKVPIVSTILRDGRNVETLYDPDSETTCFAVQGNSGQVERKTSIDTPSGQKLIPYGPQNNLIKYKAVLLPSDIKEYGTETQLLNDVRAFIHKYVDVSPNFEKIASHYVLLSWVYDRFNELPYLRVRGDYGSGKTRFLLTVGSVCYKGTFASGASTVSPIFRMIHAFRGTLIFDEANFRFSDEKSETIKILNSGNGKGIPVYRSEASDTGEYNPRAYFVFGPKIIATRGDFSDHALERRCITEEMGRRELRKDIPINLPEEAEEEARELRNKLLLFRFRTRNDKITVDERLIGGSLEPRLKQIFAPLMSMVRDEQFRKEIEDLALAYNSEVIADRGLETEGEVLKVIQALFNSGKKRVAIKDVTEGFIEAYGKDYERQITPKWIGMIVRKKFGLRAQKREGVYVLPVSERHRLKYLYKRYGLVGETETAGKGDNVDIGDNELGTETETTLRNIAGNENGGV